MLENVLLLLVHLAMTTSEVSVFRVDDKPLKTAEAISILENVKKESCSSLPPVKPKGGEIYIYLNESKGGKFYCCYILLLSL